MEWMGGEKNKSETKLKSGKLTLELGEKELTTAASAAGDHTDDCSAGETNPDVGQPANKPIGKLDDSVYAPFGQGSTGSLSRSSSDTSQG